MPLIEIPGDLFQQIQANVPAGGSVDAFVREAVREKIHGDERRKEFHRLTEKIRHAMVAKGLTEEEILADFEAHRRSTPVVSP